MNSDYKKNNDNDNEVSRRGFLKLGFGGLGFLAACRAPSVLVRPEHQGRLDRAIGKILGGPMEKYIDGFYSAITKGKVEPFTPHNLNGFINESKINPTVYADLLALNRIYGLAGQINQGLKLVTLDTQSRLCGLSEDLRKSLSKPGKKEANEFVKALRQDQRDLISETRNKEEELKDALAAFEPSQYDRVIDLATEIEKENPELAQRMREVAQGYTNQLGALQADLKVGAMLYANEGFFRQTRKLENLDNKVEIARSGMSFTDVGQAVFNRRLLEGKGTLQKLLDSKMKKAERHFRRQDLNYLDDVFRDQRFPVANASWLFHAADQTSVKEHLGTIYTLDGKLASMQVDPTTDFGDVASYIFNLFPPVAAGNLVFNRLGHAFVPETLGKETKKILKDGIVNWVGAGLGRHYVGNRGTSYYLAGLLELASTAIGTALLLKGLSKSPSGGSRGSGLEGTGGPSGQ